MKQNLVILSLVGLFLSNSVFADVVGKVNLRFKATLIDRSCSLDSGDFIEFDFGDIPTSAFSNAGAGNAATGVAVLSKNVSILCKSIAAQETVSARLITNNAKGNSIVSSNADVGFQLSDKDNQVLTPNDSNSKINFKLDNNLRGNFVLKSWPVSITGNQPTPGAITAEGHIQIDYD